MLAAAISIVSISCTFLFCMMALQLVTLCSCVAAATAFVAPTHLKNVAKSTSSLSMKFEDELGVTAPLGFWDPLGFTSDGDEAAFRRRRISEIKHGRIAMMAVVGSIVPEFFRFPGTLAPSTGLKFSDVPNSIEALTVVPLLGWVQVFAWIGFMEAVVWKQDPDMAPGDWGGEDWVRESDPAKKAEKLNKELNNGRLAMMAIMGIMVQTKLTGVNPVHDLLS
mmetsp:Transcript_33989/g.43692  ORF Transcript_33989/g.43692 Transcript_33989/m.43692 type:complete len:222 (+) Transcript_33989:30-695(+)